MADQPYQLLTIRSVDTKNSAEYKYSFAEAGYNDLSEAWVTITGSIGDPTRGKSSVLGYTRDTTNDFLREKIVEQMRCADREIIRILSDPTKKKNVIDHFNQNKRCTRIYGLQEATIHYPDPTNEDDLKKIVKHYIALQTKVNGITVDEYIDRAVNCQTSMKDSLISSIQSFETAQADKDLAKTTVERKSFYKNCVNSSFQSAKYGFIKSPPPPAEPSLYGEASLLEHGLLDTEDKADSVYLTNNDGPNSFGTGSEVPFGPTRMRLKMLIGLTYYGASGLISAFGHEFGHEMGAGPYGNGDLRISASGNIYVNTHLNEKALKSAYEKKGAVDKGEQRRIYGETKADLLGVLCVEAYIRSLPTLEEKIKEIRGASVYGNQGNYIHVGHPPQSMTRHLFLISKYIQDTLKEYLTGTRTVSTLLTLKGGKRKRRTFRNSRRKHRNTRRCRR